MSRNTFRFAFLAVCSVLALAVLAGCGDGDKSDPKTYAPDKPLGEAKAVFVEMDRPLVQREQQIVESLAKFVDAVRAERWKEVCRTYFTAKAQVKYGGDKQCAANIAKFARDFEGLSMRVLGFQHVEAGSRIAVNTQSRGTPVMHKEFYDMAPGEKGGWKIQPTPPPKTGLGG